MMEVLASSPEMDGTKWIKKEKTEKDHQHLGKYLLNKGAINKQELLEKFWNDLVLISFLISMQYFVFAALYQKLKLCMFLLEYLRY